MKGEEHLTKSAQYAVVYSKGSSQVGDLVVMRALPNGLNIARYGFSVSRRVGKAVVRNRVKRLLREILRCAPLRPGWDTIFIARPPAASAGYARLDKLVRNLLGRAQLLVKEHETISLSTN